MSYFNPLEIRRKTRESYKNIVLMDVNQIITPVKINIVCFNFLEIKVSGNNGYGKYRLVIEKVHKINVAVLRCLGHSNNILCN